MIHRAGRHVLMEDVTYKIVKSGLSQTLLRRGSSFSVWPKARSYEYAHIFVHCRIHYLFSRGEVPE